jgi:3-phenylpropionate/trans-cinnamate dioxygenase ferredoxin subunit
MEGFEKVAARGDIKDGTLTVVEIQGQEIVVTELEGNVIAFSNVCSHEDCTFVFEGAGQLEGKEIYCDCHSSRFDVLTGAVLDPPATEPIAVFAVRIEGDDVLVGPA